MWQEVLYGVQSDSAKTAKKTSDGGLIVAIGSSSIATSTRPVLVKLDASGNVVFQKYYGTTQRTSAGAFQLPGGGIVFGAGDTSSGLASKTLDDGTMPDCTQPGNGTDIPATGRGSLAIKDVTLTAGTAAFVTTAQTPSITDFSSTRSDTSSYLDNGCK